MSVFSLEVAPGNPVTAETLDITCSDLGVTIKDDEKEDYHRLLAVFHESVETLMALPDYVPGVDETRFPRQNVHYPKAENNPLNAWAWKCDIVDDKLKDGLLHGKTVALKDNISVKGVPMLIRTNVIKDYTPITDATVVTRILEAGGHIVGKSVCENLCHSGTSSSANTGHVHNPHARGYSSGGSSSGSGALVANGDVDLALGADQGGSIRIPAGWCGIYGFKPTYGLIPYTGCGSNEPTNDHLGPMTRTVEDNALLLQGVAGGDNIDDRFGAFGAPAPGALPKYFDNLKSLPNPSSLTGMRIGIITESLTISAMDPRVRDCFTKAADSFKSLGATVEEVSIPLHSQGGAIWTAISKTGGFLAKQGFVFGRRGYAMNDLNSKFSPLTQEMWDNAYSATKNIYLNGAYARKNFPGLIGKATNLSRQLRDSYDKALKEYDVLITPTLPYIAQSHTDNNATPLGQIAKQIGLTSNTAPFDQSGHPVLAMPIGMVEIQEGPLGGSGTKLPVSMQVIGRWWREDDVYKAAYAWSLTNDWKKL